MIDLVTFQPLKEKKRKKKKGFKTQRTNGVFNPKKKIRENFTYSLKLWPLLQMPHNIQNLSLRCIKVWFSLT
jgi:hypothetical protein